MTAFLAELPHRALLSVTGEDAKPFLQGLVTQHLDKVTLQHSAYSTLLSPQGKFLFEFFILHHLHGYYLECERSQREALATALHKYRLRAKVRVEEIGLGVAAVWSEIEPPIFSAIPQSGDTVRDNAVILFRDPRFAPLGARAILLDEDSLPHLAARSAQSASAEDYERHRLMLGVPEGVRDLMPDKSFIMDYGFDDLHAIDFTKGCYVGQEVTARMKHRSALRKQIYRVVANGTPAPVYGTPLLSQGSAVGEMRSSSGMEGIALLRRDVLEQQGHPETIQAGDENLKIHLPSWKIATALT